MRKLVQMLSALAAVLLVAAPALAQQEPGVGRVYGWGLPIGIALGIGLVGFAGALGQGRAASAALEGIARNPQAADKVFVPMILGLVFMESLVLFTWVLMLLMQLTM